MKATKTAMVTLTLLFAAVLASAQDRKPLPAGQEEMYTVSAKVGVLNVIEGDVSYKREQADWARLVVGDELREGDTVKTGATGRAEILLTPGCYLRLAENSAFVLTNPHVYQFRLDLTSGSAIIEASAIDGPMTVATPKDQFSIIKEGLYRFNITADGRGEVIVRKGRLTVGNAVVKEKKRATVENGQPVIASFDKKQVDGFDLWSEERARGLIAMNKRLSTRTLANNSAFGFTANAWVYSSGCGCYTFLPFGTGFSSPYGWDYAVCNPFWNSYSYYPYYGWGGYNNGGRPAAGGGSGGNSGGGNGGGTGGGHHRRPGRGDGDAGSPVAGRPGPPVRGDSTHYNPPSRSDGGRHYNPPTRSDSGPRYSPPSSAPSMPARTSMPSNSSPTGGGGHHKN